MYVFYVGCYLWFGTGAGRGVTGTGARPRTQSANVFSSIVQRLQCIVPGATSLMNGRRDQRLAFVSSRDGCVRDSTREMQCSVRFCVFDCIDHSPFDDSPLDISLVFHVVLRWFPIEKGLLAHKVSFDGALLLPMYIARTFF